VLPNETRWSGNYDMLKRFEDIKEALNAYLGDADEAKDKKTRNIQLTIQDAMPDEKMQAEITSLYAELQKFQQVSLTLQQEDGNVSLLGVQTLFDVLIKHFGDDMKYYLSQDASIINNPQFENAIINYLDGARLLTTEDEKQLVRLEHPGNNFRDISVPLCASTNETPWSEFGMAELAASVKRQRLPQRYVDLAKIPVTNNTVERFFSRVKRTKSDNKGRLYDETLEMLMYFKVNKKYLTAEAVQKAMNRMNREKVQ
jgi:hypothetical protein